MTSASSTSQVQFDSRLLEYIRGWAEFVNLQFPEPLEVSDVVQPIGMASVEPEVGAICEMAGWGKLEGGILEG